MSHRKWSEIRRQKGAPERGTREAIADQMRFAETLEEAAASQGERLHDALGLPPGMSIAFSVEPPHPPTPHELWTQARGDPDRYVELLREHGHIDPIEPCPSCGVATNHRHGAAGETIPTDIFGHDKR